MDAQTAKFREVPVKALRLSVGEFAISDANGAEAKTAPVSLTARSGRPIEHWFWGRIVHDLSGMRLHKARLPIDYAHDDKEVIGYLNRFDSSSGDLVASGALVPYKESDRANEVIYKAKQGVPYEASIFFGGDGIELEEVDEGQTVEVNGSAFSGPGVVVRSWPLRGVAICPYGADAHTETRLAEGGETCRVAVRTAKKESEMSEAQEQAQTGDAVDSAAAQDAAGAEAPGAAQDTGAQGDAEGREEGEPAGAGAAEAEALSAVEAEIKRRGAQFVAAFGTARGAAYFAQGLTLAEAREQFHAETVAERDALAREVTELKAKLAQLAGSGAAPASPSAPAPETAGPETFLEVARKFAAEKKVSLTAAMSAVAKAQPALYARHRAGK